MIVLEKMKFNDHYLFVELGGEYVLGSAKSSFIDVLEICVKYQLTRLMIDATKIKNKITVLQSEEYGFFLSKFKQFQVKVAFISRHENIHPGTPLQTSAVENGFNIMVTSNREEAREWLLKE